MLVFEGLGLGDMYFKIFRYLQARGRRVVVRGHKMVEIPEPVTLVYKSPGACWMSIPQRRFNPFFALAEVVWILQGRGDIDWISFYNKKMRDFNDGDPNNHGAYGIRLRQARRDSYFVGSIDQIKEVVKKLREDPTTRQAVMTIWDPSLDNRKSKDIPCNNWVGYTLRKDLDRSILDQMVVMRSNDFVWGAPYNAVQFTHLHALIAGELGAQMGTYTCVINNLHYYQELYPDILGNLMEHSSCSECDRAVKAIAPVNFCTGTDSVVQRIAPIIDTSPHKDYWSDTIPKVLGLFQLLRNETYHKQKYILPAATMLNRLPAPFKELAWDHLIVSKESFVNEVLRETFTAPE